LGADGSPDGIDVDPFHQREVDHQAAFGDCFSGDVVPAASDRQLEPGVPGGIDGVNHISGVEAPCDERWPLVDQAVVNFASDLVAGVVRSEQEARESFA
jgi:hypothetical protein